MKFCNVWCSVIVVFSVCFLLYLSRIVSGRCLSGVCLVLFVVLSVSVVSGVCLVLCIVSV